MIWKTRLFCTHDYQFQRNIHGDEINIRNGKRSLWKCLKCSSLHYSNSLVLRHTWLSLDEILGCSIDEAERYRMPGVRIVDQTGKQWLRVPEPPLSNVIYVTLNKQGIILTAIRSDL